MSGGTVIETLSALAIVLATIVALRAGLARFGIGRSAMTRRLRLIESLSLGARQRVVLVDVDGEPLLIGVGDGPVTLLRRLPVPEASEAAEASPEETDRTAAHRLVATVSTAAVSAGRAGSRGNEERSHAGLSLARIAALTPALPSRLRDRLRLFGICFLCLLLGSLAGVAGAETKDAVRVGGDLAGQIAGLTQPDRLASTLEIVALLTAVSVAPSILLMATCFTRIIIVFAFLRQAVGVPQLPPNQVLAALAFFTTLFVMAPVGARIQTDALEPYLARQLEPREAASRAVTPVREFLLSHTRDKDLGLFVGMSGHEAPEKPEDVTLPTLLPAFMISELRTAFEIGFMIYLPFLVIDIVIASLLISMGMIVLPPIVISLPFKLMLFVLLDGWNLVLSSLVTGLR